MIEVNRKTAPPYHLIGDIDMIRAAGYPLPNGTEVYWINGGSQDVVKVEFIFNAGARMQSKPLIASVVNNTFFEGTSKHTGLEIASQIDYYGAFLHADSDYDFANVSLFTLNKHAASVFPIVKEVLTQATFPEKEVGVYTEFALQKYLVNLRKVNFLARKYFRNAIFGSDHIYGSVIEPEAFKQVDRADLKHFYDQYYRANNCTIVISGRVTDEIHSLVQKHFGDNWLSGYIEPFQTGNFIHEREKHLLVPVEEAVQSAIRIGRPMFNKTHQDFPSMQVLNTVLGGYFGSRLMKNIREDKGYTYGISSGLASMKESGYFFIATEVGCEVTQQTLSEIHHEMRRLREELIPEDELDTVRNYIMGTFLRSIDGPFALAERFKAIFEYDLSYDYYDRFIDTVKNITSEELIELARTYLEEEDMTEVVAGKLEATDK